MKHGEFINYEQSGIKQQNGNLGFTLQYFNENMDTHYLHIDYFQRKTTGFPYLFHSMSMLV